jgi:hypothetical protein
MLAVAEDVVVAEDDAVIGMGDQAQRSCYGDGMLRRTWADLGQAPHRH